MKSKGRLPQNNNKLQKGKEIHLQVENNTQMENQVNQIIDFR